jgi:hypothetical protein
VLLCVSLLQKLLAHWEESGKLSDIEAGNSLHSVKLLRIDTGAGSLLKNTDKNVNALQVLSVIKVDKGRLPEFFSVDRRPAESSARHLSLPFVEAGEFLVILVEIFEKLLKDALNSLIDPRSVAQLDHQVEGIDHREVLQAERIILQVEENHANHAHDLLFVGEVEDFGDMLDHVHWEILEHRQRKLVRAQDPEAAAHIVCNLGLLLALFEQELSEHLKSALVDKLLSDLIDLQDVH